MGEFIDQLMSWTGAVEEWVLGIADAWWVHLVVFGFAATDGFFPSVPGESTIVTLSSLWSTSGRPSIILVGLAAWIGAWTGDNIGSALAGESVSEDARDEVSDDEDGGPFLVLGEDGSLPLDEEGDVQGDGSEPIHQAQNDRGANWMARGA